ncbi:hypothetical protein [Salinisphaera sp. LB1]|uniref:hypothetical protein n=1 Tax=Salinisphaera sp. LB1 TaxID=2183911 RepID=UPI0011AB7BB7|nr:hypothetical protein [Salinisphaera sp. LB1]
MKDTAYIIEIPCKPASSSSQLTSCHATVCAISETKDAAVLMAEELLMSYGYIAESAASASEKISLPQDESSELDESLYQKALQRQPRCALALSVFDPNAQSHGVSSIGTPDKGSSH